MYREWSEEMIEETIRVFKPYADEVGEKFTRDDAIESMDNMVNLFELLYEMDRNLRKKEMPKLINVLKRILSLKASS